MANRVGLGAVEIQPLCPRERTFGLERSAFPPKAAGISESQVRLTLARNVGKGHMKSQPLYAD
jgi:hypothetical protein